MSLGNTLRRFRQSTIANQASMVFGIFVTFATVGNVVVATLQFKTAQASSVENSKQTERLIEAARYQAHAADLNAQASQSFAASADGINRGVTEAINKLHEQSLATERARRTTQAAAQSALDASLESFRVEQRPWLIFDLVPTSGLKFDKELRWGADWRVRLRVTNVGKTPATHVRFSTLQANVVIPEVSEWTRKEGPLLNNICTSLADAPKDEGLMIFPGETLTFSDVTAWIPGSQLVKSSPHAISIIASQCVSYTPTFHTDKAYYVGHNFRLGQTTSDHFRLSFDVPAEQLIMSPSPFSPGTTAR